MNIQIKIENLIFDWKIKNIVTYMDSIKYINESNILFLVEINDNIYNFSLEYCNDNLINKWILKFVDIIDQKNVIHFKILAMVEIINEKFVDMTNNIQSLNLPKSLINLMDIIEKVIEEFDFDEDSDTDSNFGDCIYEEITKTEKQEDKIIDTDSCDFESIMDMFEKQNKTETFTDETKLQNIEDLESDSDTKNIISTYDSKQKEVKVLEPANDISKNKYTRIDSNDDLSSIFLTDDSIDFLKKKEDYFDDLNADNYENSDDEKCIECKVYESDNNSEAGYNSGLEYESESEFKTFATNISKKSSDNKFNYFEFKSRAYEIIDKIRTSDNSNLESKLFKPEHSVSIIINEIKRLITLPNIKLDIDDNNIYKLMISYQSKKLSRDILLSINLDPLEYPFSPPNVNVMKPLMTYNLNYFINTMDYFKLENWNPVNSLVSMVQELVELIDKYGIVSEHRDSYSELTNLLTNLSIISKTNPKLTLDNSETIMFQIPFIKLNKDTDTTQKLQNWKSGTGYGSSGSKSWDIKKYLESDKYKNQKIHYVISDIYTNIEQCISDPQYNPWLLDDIINSCLVEFIISTLIDNMDYSYFDSDKTYVETMIKMCKNIFELNNSIYDNFESNFRSSNDCLNLLRSTIDSNPLIREYIELHDYIIKYFDNKKKNGIIINDSINTNNTDIRTVYVDTMKQLQFAMVKDLKNAIDKPNQGKAINMMRLMRETTMLSKSLPMDYESSVYLRVDPDNMQSMHALIIPSHGTPYDSGCFLFHIYVPNTFPSTPPLVKIMTTGNGTVRFNPNLYNCGKVCLSLLGTWRGDESESWNESSTILQVLISIQSLIFIDQPYFNEPGYERNMNSDYGKNESIKYNQSVQYNTLSWAMVDMLKNPPKGFEEVVLNHFKIKKEYILKTVKDWLINIPSNNEQFNFKYQELCGLLNDL